MRGGEGLKLVGAEQQEEDSQKGREVLHRVVFLKPSRNQLSDVFRKQFLTQRGPQDCRTCLRLSQHHVPCACYPCIPNQRWHALPLKVISRCLLCYFTFPKWSSLKTRLSFLWRRRLASAMGLQWRVCLRLQGHRLFLNLWLKHSFQDVRKGGLSLRGVAFMTVWRFCRAPCPPFDCPTNAGPIGNRDGFGGFGGHGGFGRDG